MLKRASSNVCTTIELPMATSLFTLTCETLRRAAGHYFTTLTLTADFLHLREFTTLVQQFHNDIDNEDDKTQHSQNLGLRYKA